MGAVSEGGRTPGSRIEAASEVLVAGSQQIQSANDRPEIRS